MVSIKCDDSVGWRQSRSTSKTESRRTKRERLKNDYIIVIIITFLLQLIERISPCRHTKHVRFVAFRVHSCHHRRPTVKTKYLFFSTQVTFYDVMMRSRSPPPFSSLPSLLYSPRQVHVIHVLRYLLFTGLWSKYIFAVAYILNIFSYHM